MGAMLVLALAAACGDDRSAAERPDGGALPAECLAQPTPPGWSYPAGPYGTNVGHTIAEFSLEDCDGNRVAFGDVLSEADLVLVTVGAGWCIPCIEESMTLEAETFEPFCARGLRIIDILFQDDQSNPATKLFCGQWRAQFGFSFPVLVDPLFTLEPYFGGPASTQTPLNLLVDRQGVIRWRTTGTAPADLNEQIELLLP